MEFRLGDQLYALPLLSVKEVISKPESTPVPNMPVFFDGMINLRGQILGIYNVRKKLGAKPKETESSDVVIIIEYAGASVGMIVDEVTRVLTVQEDQIGSVPLKEDDPARHFIGAVIQINKELILTLHVPQLLELEKFNYNLKSA